MRRTIASLGRLSQDSASSSKARNMNMARNKPAEAISVDRSSPKVAVVVPIFKHSALLSEAIESVLAQRADFGILLVLVNDGCPHIETDMVCREYALTYPDQVVYLRKPNGGLSDARNHGIRHALSNWRSIDAVYMLDADNRLRRDALSNAKSALDLDPDAGWIYPNIDMFGLNETLDYGGEYSLLIHSIINICEAGSLIRRQVFDAGIYFDTSFKSGFEDWDFFLTAAGAGFKGHNIENFGFLYRKRPESMLADSDRDADAIRSEMRKKHKALFSPRGLLALEQQEAPRYAIFLSDRQEVLLTVDPDVHSARRVSFSDFEQSWWRTQMDNTRYSVPPILVMTNSQTLDQLRRARMLHSTLWTMERRLKAHCFVGLQLALQPQSRIAWSDVTAPQTEAISPSILMAQPGIMSEVARDNSLSWVRGLLATPCQAPISLLQLRLPEALFSADDRIYCNAADDLVDFAHRSHSSPHRDAMVIKWDWRDGNISWRSRPHDISAQLTRSDAAYPKVADGIRDVGFALPLVEFGGVERVALNIARVMKDAGWRNHLFILDSADCQVGDEWLETFESITFLSDKNFRTWGAASNNYLGTGVPDWVRSGDQRQAIAMLAWLDLVINFHGGAISGIMGQLKRLGVKTALSLHLSDQTPYLRPVGNTYLGLAFEHAYDIILPCSQELSDWCHAMGVPSEKITPLLNAPSFVLPSGSEDRIYLRRAARSSSVPLRIIYLGRLDQQKGVDRLMNIVEITQARGLPVEWRLIGKSVIEDGKTDIRPHIVEILEPALATPQELADAYEWADVFILPSYYEGLPLTILEAMRSGVIPIATNAGAVSEVIEHWTNGVILSQIDTVAEAVKAIEMLATEPTIVQEMSTRARADMIGRNWNNSVRPFLEQVEKLLTPAKEPSRSRVSQKEETAR